MLESVMIGRANIARMNCRFCVSRLSDSACRRSMEQSKFLFSLPPPSLWYSRYHNVPPGSLIYADKRILSGVKIQEPGLCSSFSKRHAGEVYEKLVPTRRSKKEFCCPMRPLGVMWYHLSHPAKLKWVVFIFLAFSQGAKMNRSVESFLILSL